MAQESCSGSVGIVQPSDYLFEEELPLDCGRSLKGVVIRYETYGRLSPNADNAVLVEHALSGDAHLAGYHSPEDKKPGWWDDMVGPGKPFDTDKLFIVCSNIIGGCSGSTGPRSIDPETGRRYDMDFPIITIADMVRAQERLMRHLGIKKWFCVAGGSMGGMLALQWGVSYPEAVNGTIAIATTARVSSQGISFNWVSREAIMNDQHWLDGNYEEQPHRGLATARMLAHITYLSDESMNRKFGRALQESPASDYEFAFSKDFRIESYLAHQGSKFVERFDANSYLYITRAIDYFDLSDCADGNLSGALKAVTTPFLIVSFSSDWLFPAYQSKELVRALLDNGNDVTYCNIQSSYGHDAFLLETEALGSLISSYLTNLPWGAAEMNVKFNNNEIQLQRSDLAAIRDMIPENAHITDLGCGSGRLLYALKTLKHAKVMGVERDQQKILECAARGIPVIHASLDTALTDFCDGSYDYVILSRTIQSVQRPDIILNEMLRIGKRGIVSYMNFGHINARIQLLCGHMPVNRNLPLPWYNTPTIRPGTTSDFKDLCKCLDIKICREIPLTNEGDYLRRMAVLWPNLFASNSIFVISK